MTKPDAYQIVTDKVLAALEKGVAPWQKPWEGRMPMSMSTNRHYRGINLFLLDGGYWGTYKKIKELGGQVRKGEKGSIAVFWKRIEREDEDGNDASFMMLRYYRVFHSTQADWEDGMPERFKTTDLGPENQRIAAADQIVTDYRKSDNAPMFDAEGWDHACYIPSRDAIQVPSITQFVDAGSYYSTLFHEMGHSTGHESRLAREGVVNRDMFGSHRYAQEELVAEMTAAMLMGVVGLEDDTIENTAAYLEHWRDTIARDNKLIVRAAAQAQKAADLIQGITWGDDDAS